MKQSDHAKTPWAPAAYFTNGALLAFVGWLLVRDGSLLPVGVVVLVAGAVMLLIGAIKKGTAQTPNGSSD
jgi:hypothetical protein